MITLTIPQFITLYGGIFACILALGQLAVKNRGENNFVMAALFFCIGYSHFLRGLYLHPAGGTLYNVLRLTNVSIFFCIGPLLYLYFKYVIHENFRLRTGHLVHFIPFPVSMIILGITSFTPIDDFLLRFFDVNLPRDYTITAMNFLSALTNVSIV